MTRGGAGRCPPVDGPGRLGVRAPSRGAVSCTPTGDSDEAADAGRVGYAWFFSEDPRTDGEVRRGDSVLDLRTRSDHDETMKRAMVSELKARLSAYLAEVRRGESVVVCDRTTPIARLVPYEPEENEGFDVLPASRPVTDLKKVRRVRPKRPIDVVRLLREDRDAR